MLSNYCSSVDSDWRGVVLLHADGSSCISPVISIIMAVLRRIIFVRATVRSFNYLIPVPNKIPMVDSLCATMEYEWNPSLLSHECSNPTRLELPLNHAYCVLLLLRLVFNKCQCSTNCSRCGQLTQKETDKFQLLYPCSVPLAMVSPTELRVDHDYLSFARVWCVGFWLLFRSAS